MGQAWQPTPEDSDERIPGSKWVILSSGFQMSKIIGRVAVDDCALCPADKGLWAEEPMGADIPRISC